MTALSASRVTKRKEGAQLSYPVAASTTIYKGGLVALNTSGYAVPAADTANLIVVGVAQEKVDNSSGSNGDLEVAVATGVFLLDATSITQAMEGQLMYVADDQTFDDSSTNSVIAGILVGFESTSSGWLWVSPLIGTTVEKTLAALGVTATAAELNTLDGVLTGSTTWDPGSLVDGAGETKSLTVTGAALGDFVLVSAPYDLQDMIATGYVQAADTVEIRLQNESGATVDLASGTWRVLIIPQ